MAYFQWLNAAMDAAPPSRPPLFINMDETAILRRVVACVARLSRPLRRCKWLLIGHRCRHAEVPSLCLPASQAMSVSKLICRRSWLEMNTPVHCKCFGQLAAGWAMPSYGARSLLGTTIARCASGWHAWQKAWGLWSQRDMWSFLLMFAHPTLMVRSFPMPAGAVWGWFTSQQSLLPICNLATPMSLPCWSRLCGKVGWRKKQNRKREWFARSPGWSLFAMQ